MIKIILFSLLFFTISCQDSNKFDITGRYYPNEYRGELSLSADSLILISNNILQAGDQATVSLLAINDQGQPTNSGGSLVYFFVEGVASGAFSATVDHGTGVYTSIFTATKVGSGLIRARLNPIKKLVVTGAVPITISVGNLSLINSTITISPSVIIVGNSLNFTLTTKDAANNVFDDGGNFIIYPTLLDGTSEGTFGAISYIGNGQYKGSLTGTVRGSATKINLSIRHQGSVLSTSTFTVMP